jgi:hypothetical protein
VSGTLVWLADSKAGVAFQSTISVADWLPTGKRATRQRLIDEVVHRSRVGATPAPSSMVGPHTTEFTLSEELERIGASLLRAAEELTSDAGITARHAAPLQAIDVAARALARIATDQLPCSRRASA